MQSSFVLGSSNNYLQGRDWWGGDSFWQNRRCRQVLPPHCYLPPPPVLGSYWVLTPLTNQVIIKESSTLVFTISLFSEYIVILKKLGTKITVDSFFKQQQKIWTLKKMSKTNVLDTLLFYQIGSLKNGVLLVLASSLPRDESTPKTTRIFQFLWGIVEGRTNRAQPSKPILKNGQNGTF